MAEFNVLHTLPHKDKWGEGQEGRTGGSAATWEVVGSGSAGVQQKSPLGQVRSLGEALPLP